MKKEKDRKDWLTKKIESGATSREVANSWGISQSQVIRIAQDLGLKFKGKTHWRKL